MTDYIYRGTDEYDHIAYIRRVGSLIKVEMLYPSPDRIDHIEIGMDDVRSADNIRVSYDFDRDGWKIEQASTFSWGPDETDFDEDWQEVAFVPAWGRSKETGWEL